MSEAPTVDDTGDWRRLSPLTLLLAVVKLGPRSVQMIPALAAIGIAGSWLYVVPALCLFLLISLGFAWAAWMRFRWRIGDDAIVIESGIFDRQHRTIPFDRIQDVSIEQGLVARSLSIARVSFETGASGDADKSDGGLDSIGLDDAAALRATIRDWRSGTTVTANGVAAVVTVSVHDQTEGAALFAMTPRQLLMAGLFNFSLAALAVVFAVGQWFDGLLPFDIFNYRMWKEIAIDNGVGNWVAAHQWVAGVGAVAALLFVGFATGVVRTVMTNWNFLLSLGPRAFRRVRGLTTRTDVAIPLARIQAAVVATGILRRCWGWHELRVQSLASDSKHEKDHQLIPFGQLSDIDAALDATNMVRPHADSIWHRPALLAQAYPGFIGAGGSFVAAGVLMAFGQPWWPIPVLIAAWLIGGSVLGARQHRWAEEGTTLYIWRGWWNPRLTILPFANIQSADLRDGPILRGVDCVALVLGVPGDSRFASHSIDAVPVHEAAALRQRILATRLQRT